MMLQNGLYVEEAYSVSRETGTKVEAESRGVEWKRQGQTAQHWRLRPCGGAGSDLSFFRIYLPLGRLVTASKCII
jgi:hypothetical protein